VGRPAGWGDGPRPELDVEEAAPPPRIRRNLVGAVEGPICGGGPAAASGEGAEHTSDESLRTSRGAEWTIKYPTGKFENADVFRK